MLRHVATGLSNGAVARGLDLAETTVKTHLRALYSRLGVGSRTAAGSTRVARRAGIQLARATRSAGHVGEAVAVQIEVGQGDDVGTPSSPSVRHWQ